MVLTYISIGLFAALIAAWAALPSGEIRRTGDSVPADLAPEKVRLI